MAPGILSSNTFSSAISNCCVCFTSSLLTEAIQAHAAPTFPPPFLSKHTAGSPTSFESTGCLFFFPLTAFVSHFTPQETTELQNTRFTQLHYFTTNTYALIQ